MRQFQGGLKTNLQMLELTHLLKEVQYFKKNNRFQEFSNGKYFKEIKHLKSLQKEEVYLGPKRASIMELFCEYT